MDKPIDRHDPDFPYKKEKIDIKKSPEEYPIIERLNNGLLFPEGPKDVVDFIDYEDF